MQIPGQDSAYALSDFVEAVKLYASGVNDRKMQSKGCDRPRATKKTIDKYTGSYDLLPPLLEHEDKGVRFKTALALIDDHYDRVLPVLHALGETSLTGMSVSGAMVLQMYGEPNTGSGPDTVNTAPEWPRPRLRATSAT